MATRKTPPPRPWDVDMLLVLGKREGEKGKHLKAIPVLILEKWVQGGRKKGEANCIWATEMRTRLEMSGLASFKPKGTAIPILALLRIQRARNLTNPPLIVDHEKGESFLWINLPRYESLLQEYRRKYRELFPEDYKKLFPKGEPEWEQSSFSPVRLGSEANESTHAKPELQDEIQRLLAPAEQVLRNQQQTIERLTEENQKLQAELEAKTHEASGVSFVHTSPDFHHSEYGGKITSIKDSIGGMLKRAKHAIRISTRQMDMFTDDLIALKRRSPEIEITVLSRGPQGAEGDRKKLAGMAFDRMKQAGIKLAVEKDALHSRLVVIDTKEVLVSSADLDFTQMDLEFNAGIWTNNPDVVAEAIRYFDNLLRLSQGN